MSRPPGKWVGFGALKEAEQAKRERAAQPDEKATAPGTPITETPVSLTPVTGTPVKKPVEPPSLTSVVTQTPVTQTPVSTTAVTQTGVTVIPVDERLWLNNPAIFNWALDEFLPTLDHNAQAVMFRLLRLTLGFRRRNCVVAIAKLAQKTRLSEPTITRVIRALREDGYIATEAVIGGQRNARGIGFYLTEKSLPPPTIVERTPIRQTPVRGTGVTQIDMKDLKNKKEREAPVAVAPAPDVLSVYDVRRIAARFRELHNGESDYTRERLRADVCTALIGDGREVDERLVAEAIGP
jgi:DNA-binding Lrp family transcriptional regulator